jgi:hypothetical protein
MLIEMQFVMIKSPGDGYPAVATPVVAALMMATVSWAAVDSQ